MKRLLAGLVLLVGMAAVYGYVVTDRESAPSRPDTAWRRRDGRRGPVHGHRGLQRRDRAQERLDDRVSDARRRLSPPRRTGGGPPRPAAGGAARPGRAAASRTTRRRQLGPSPLHAGRRALSGVRGPRRSIAARSLQARAGAVSGGTGDARHRGPPEGTRHRRQLRRGALSDGPLPA